ncbi:variable surface protein [Plasmodium gonderi]|uniref:Variable surface protein n=1 Tax=Plasmodium gonderi TaxID=77519 RepID=A0A1Y1JQY6_PLAGO|nr:variable surface protein [Plasmodium gonderi]GAW83915.1 variable surface protein [Plasmodium gonderi]
MQKIDYSNVKHFLTYKEIMDGYEVNSGDSYAHKCKGLYNSYSFDVESRILEKCPQAISYLKRISDYDDKNKRIIAYNYLHYWIYHDLLQEKKIENNNLPSIYLINVFKEIYKNKSLSDFYSVKFKTNDDLEKLSIIYEMHKNYDILEKFCLNRDKNGFCDIIKEKIDPYMKIFKIKDIVATKEEVKTTCKSNVSGPIVITFVVTLLICIFLFILIKVNCFTSYGTYLRLGLDSIKKKLSTLGEYKTLQNSDISSRIAMNERYNILYNVE